ncbi:hypothetical protein N7448_002955 [Penicillium atrosanguineum]|nr:hypothetical protein N7448_002955 [Penicillium atrosanguineum]
MADVPGTSKSGQRFQSRGFETSIDVARRQAYHVAPVAGYKRPSTEQPVESLKSVVLRGPNETEEILESPLEFARASLAPSANLRFILVQEHQPPHDGQQRSVSTAPGSSQNPLLSLTNPKYGLPASLTANFAALGVHTIYAWQASCLLARGLLSGERHLVYTAPTGGGKSLVADVLLLKRIIENPTRKAILVLPYVALSKRS